MVALFLTSIMRNHRAKAQLFRSFRFSKKKIPSKIHKPWMPFRPILPAFNTAMYKIAKFLVPLIELFTSNEFPVSNSYNFYNSIMSLNDSGMSGCMICFYISSLYTNIPVVEAINILWKDLYANFEFLISASFSLIFIVHFE